MKPAGMIRSYQWGWLREAYRSESIGGGPEKMTPVVPDKATPLGSWHSEGDYFTFDNSRCGCFLGFITLLQRRKASLV
jgi:hypothetical protein